MSTDKTKKKKHFLSPNVLFQKVIDTAGAVANTAGAVAHQAVTAPMSVIPGVAAAGSGGPKKNEKLDGPRHLRNIFAVPLNAKRIGGQKVSDLGSLTSYSHAPAETKFLKENLKDHYLFENLAPHELQRLVSAFEPFELPAGEEDTVLIRQGEWARDDTAYFYLLYEGRCQFLVNDQVVGDTAIPGDCFGELALLYNCPRAATVKAFTSLGTVKLFRIHQTGFRYVLQHENESPDHEKLHLLDGVAFLKQCTNEQRVALAQAMKPVVFEKGDHLVKLNEPVSAWYILERGQVRSMSIASENDTGSQGKYQPISFKEGDYFGELMIHLGIPNKFDVVAETDGLVFTIDKETFKSVLGDLGKIVIQSSDFKRLKGVKAIAEAIQGEGGTRVLSYLVSQIQDIHYPKGYTICLDGQPLKPPAFYLVREGQVHLSSKNGVEVIDTGSFFGEDQLYYDTNPGEIVASYTATVTKDCVLGVLKLNACRKVMNTKRLGQGSLAKLQFDSLKISGTSHLSIQDIERHRILGAGTFGQVWLVTRRGTDGIKHAYALKIQSKYELVQNGQARGVVHEKKIMEQLQHPFVGGLVASFQDTSFVYMLMPLIQGGELYSVMHMNHDHKMQENHAQFYIAGIAEGLTYMHRRGFVYRDLKPENVLVDGSGYPVIVDFGFAKYVIDKTFTLCGTPLYIAPEVILNRGHNYGADHWSLGCLIYEMLDGRTPFYEEGMDQTQLMRAIVKGGYEMPHIFSAEARSIVQGLLTRNPDKRLGNLAGGLEDVLYHPWLSRLDHDSLLLKELKAPFVPRIKDAFDGSNFEDWGHASDKTKTKYPALKESDARLFDDF